jgi:hypothetical protein
VRAAVWRTEFGDAAYPNLGNGSTGFVLFAQDNEILVVWMQGVRGSIQASRHSATTRGCLKLLSLFGLSGSIPGKKLGLQEKNMLRKWRPAA